jgi:hypothetical protein
MLAIALVAMITGTVLLLLIWKRYDMKTKVSAVTPAATSMTVVFQAHTPVWAERARLA